MQPRSYKAIFFDLDGTLLPIDMEAFLHHYFEDLGTFAAEHGYEAAPIFAGVKAGMAATFAGGTTTNKERFWQAFMKEAKGSVSAYEQLFTDYYKTDFNKLGSLVAPNPAAARAIETLQAKGYPLFLTTMPLFPRVAVEARLTWAKVSPRAFKRITTYDNSTATKPNLAYYQENIALTGVDANDVLMVGNNTLEDLSAMGLGCDGYLVTDWLLNPNEFDIETVKHGTLAEFAQFADALPECADPAPVACDSLDAKAGC